MARRGTRGQTRRLLSVPDEANAPRWGRAVGKNRWSEAQTSLLAREMLFESFHLPGVQIPRTIFAMAK